MEYLDDISLDGKFKCLSDDKIIRLFDFDAHEATKFSNSIYETIIVRRESLDLGQLDFIRPINCKLILRIADLDLGILSIDENNFVCELSLDGYLHMVDLIAPFTQLDSHGYQWLYDLNCEIEFLFSPLGTW